jgi:hypothetical protein
VLLGVDFRRERIAFLRLRGAAVKVPVRFVRLELEVAFKPAFLREVGLAVTFFTAERSFARAGRFEILRAERF